MLTRCICFVENTINGEEQFGKKCGGPTCLLLDTAVMEMHLEYSPDTPVDYSAPGFEDTNQAVKIAGPPEEIFNKKFNPLPTPYHKMQLKMKSRFGH